MGPESKIRTHRFDIFEVNFDLCALKEEARLGENLTEIIYRDLTQLLGYCTYSTAASPTIHGFRLGDDNQELSGYCGEVYLLPLVFRLG